MKNKQFTVAELQEAINKRLSGLAGRKYEGTEFHSWINGEIAAEFEERGITELCPSVWGIKPDMIKESGVSLYDDIAKIKAELKRDKRYKWSAGRGLVFIESRYLSPVSDVLDVLELYERVTPFGAPYIVAKAGFLLQAVIMPCDVISAQFVQRLQELTRQCAVSLDLREQERERQAAAESAGQFKVDPETGAIIEPESEAGDDD